ncbi:hypothetical protein [Desulfovibrio oxyclinae]|uniref:hypothetical protein n=1 Tax=Desulfovibrio oxyclinae TaxID=63560 RepID=UPI0012EA26DB|nr:hypothetical protein [Desulfovibrio oxyclinae]
MMIEATWIVQLLADCPDCGATVDLLDHPEFWDGRFGLEPGDDVGLEEVVCPECGHEFDVKAVY